MDALCEEPAGGSKRRRGAGVTSISSQFSSNQVGLASKPRRGRPKKTQKEVTSALQADTSQKPATKVELELKKKEQPASPEISVSDTHSGGKGKGKSKGKQHSLRPRKANASLSEADLEAAAYRSAETLVEPFIEAHSKKGKARKRKSPGRLQSQAEPVKVEDTVDELVIKSKGKRKSSDKKSNKGKSSFVVQAEALPSYRVLEDFAEFEDLLSSKLSVPIPKKRCLRSSSNEEKETTSAIIAPGPSTLKPPSHPKKSDSTPSCSKKSELSDSKILKSLKSGSKSKEEKSVSKGKTRSRKTGSCASNSGRQSSAAGRGTGRAGASRGTRERIDPNKNSIPTNTLTLAAMSSGSHQQDNSGSSGARPRENAGSGAMSQAEGLVFGAEMPPGAVGGTVPDNESDDSDMNRLQALLESRGLSSHFIDALAPRMQQLLHRTMSGGASRCVPYIPASMTTKVQHLLQGLQATGDEAQQLSAVMEMCQILVMGNEESLVGFPVKLVVPALIHLLQMEHNFEMMIHASRALTYMMEALPRSSASVVEGVAVFLEKLQVINCMDVAEQSLTALETLSKRHGKAILTAGGIAACLMFLDFFSIIAQRRALNITANCVQTMSADEFHYIRDSLSLLSSRLNNSDNKSVESVCLCFARLVDNFQNDQRLLKEIAVHDLLTNIQQLLMMSPPVISTSVFITVVRMLVVMCANCPDLAVILLKQKIAETLRYLLTGSENTDQCFELVSRTPQELYEIVSLIGELLPRLPTDGLFTVNSLLRKGASINHEGAFWQFQDDRGLWHMYTPIDNKILEDAYQGGEEEASLSTMGRSYLLDFNTMQQINEDTGTSRPVVRKVNSLGMSGQNSAAGDSSKNYFVGQMDPNVERCDSRAEILKEDQDLASGFVQTLFAVLYEVYSSSAGPNIRHKCLETVLRMIYYSQPDLLRQVLVNQSVSSHIACMLGSPDLKVVVGALQMANIIMQKLPDIYSINFRREGVMNQIQKLAVQEVASSSPNKSTHSPGSVLSSVSDSSCALPSAIPQIDPPDVGEGDDLFGSGASYRLDGSCASSAHTKLSDVLKRKRPPRRGPSKKGSKSEDCATAEASPKGVGLLLGRSSTRGKSSSGKEARSSSSSSKIPFLTNLNPRSWGRMGSTPDRQSTMKEMLAHKQMPPPIIVNKEKVKSWIKEQCKLFMEKYFSADMYGEAHPAWDMLKRLRTATKCLSLQGDSGLDCLLEIATIMKESDVTPFEVIHSGFITQILEYLTSTNSDVSRELRIRRFLHVFLNCPPPSVTYMKEPPNDTSNTPSLSYLVSKLMACLHQLEQFQVKVHDLPGGTSGTSRGGNALKFFTTHQLKCQLQRHPACTTLKQWKGGPVKIDPLALVQAIEKYLLSRGFGKAKEGADEELSDDDNSDEEMEEQMASIMISATSPRHRLEFLIGDHVLPYNMTVYQAVKQFVCHGGTEVGDFSDGDTDSPFGNTSIWVQTHTIWYRPATEQEENMATSPKKTKAESKSSKSSKKKDSRASSPATQPVLQSFLLDKLPPTVTVQDASIETIALLRVLHALNRHWSSMYDINFLPNPILPATEFISSKLTAKANRQLQDPLIIMTSNLPNWLPEIGQVAPFLLPFDTRQMLFFATTFDRDRAVLRLQQDQAGESSTHDNERVGPRLDRKRREVSRKDILKQAEKVMEDMGGSTNARTMLEIHYENEVGTGLGPTLEFYALVSKELQRADLELWRGESITATSPADPNVMLEYTQSHCGLFPLPLHRNSKASHVNKVKAKFKFLGKFMAKALMDSRMIDLPLSRVFYKWILGQENSLNSSDLYHVDRTVARSFQQLENLVHQKKEICNDKTKSEEEKKEAITNLTLDGSQLEDLDLYFVLPGSDNIELCKGGRDIQVVMDNLEDYLQLVIHWTLVDGISKQFEAFKEGFESMFSLTTLQCFYPEELEQLFCGNVADVWDVRMLMDCCKPDHGYTHDSQAVKFLFEVLSSYNTAEQRDFLQFVTGSPRLPVGGFKSLNPPLTVVRKQPEGSDDPDSYLPSVMTCVNYLKLPDYSSLEVMRERLNKAAKEGQLSFHLS